MRLHRCAEISCRELIKIGFEYCDKHYQQRMKSYQDRQTKAKALNAKTLRGQHDKEELNREYNQQVRLELGHAFYQSKQWKRISQYIKQRDMYTDAVDGKAYDKGDLIVDHLIPRRLLESTAEQYDTKNLWLLTREHHNHKTAIEKKMSDSKLKHISRDWWIKVLKD